MKTTRKGPPLSLTLIPYLIALFFCPNIDNYLRFGENVVAQIARNAKNADVKFIAIMFLHNWPVFKTVPFSSHSPYLLSSQSFFSLPLPRDINVKIVSRQVWMSSTSQISLRNPCCLVTFPLIVVSLSPFHFLSPSLCLFPSLPPISTPLVFLCKT